MNWRSILRKELALELNERWRVAARRERGSTVVGQAECVSVSTFLDLARVWVVVVQLGAETSGAMRGLSDCGWRPGARGSIAERAKKTTPSGGVSGPWSLQVNKASQVCIFRQS